jgi:hypothetical protein
MSTHPHPTPPNMVYRQKIYATHPNNNQKTTQNKKPNTTTNNPGTRNLITTHPHKNKKTNYAVAICGLASDC